MLTVFKLVNMKLLSLLVVIFLIIFSVIAGELNFSTNKKYEFKKDNKSLYQICLDPHLCELPHTEGNIQCRARKHRYHYNADKGECEDVIYGGCHATGNNFQTIEECQRICGDYKRNA